MKTKNIISTHNTEMPVQLNIQSQYINKFELWLASPDKYLAWARLQGTNSINCYARTYLKDRSGRKKLAAFVLKAKQYSINEVFIDYRKSSEGVNWESYFKEYPGIEYRIHPITEIEPYITGDYAGFTSALKTMDVFCTKYNLIAACYMGHPSQSGWDNIVKYCDRIYLSLYVSMATYKAGKSYNYAAGRWEKIAMAAKKINKKKFPVVYIKSLERKVWGASNDFQGELYTTNSFYGSVHQKDVTDYLTKSSAEIKTYTNLIGTCMFTSEYNLKARPQ